MPRRGAWLVAAALMAAGCREGGPAPTLVPRTPVASPAAGGVSYPAGKARIDLGQATFAQHCAECHGSFGKGDGLEVYVLEKGPPDMTDAAYMATQRPDYYYRAISEGIPGTAMLRWDMAIDDGRRWDLAYFAWTRATPRGAVERGRATYAASCAECHGDDGNAVAVAPLATGAAAHMSRADWAAAAAKAHPEAWSALAPDDQKDVVEALAAFLYATGP